MFFVFIFFGHDIEGQQRLKRLVLTVDSEKNFFKTVKYASAMIKKEKIVRNEFQKIIRAGTGNTVHILLEYFKRQCSKSKILHLCT